MNKQATIDWPTVLKLFGGGALTGAGLGAGTSLVRYLQSLNETANQEKDDDVLYIDLPKKNQPMANRRMQSAPKWASANTVGTFAMGTTAGLLGTFLAYKAVRDAYQRSRKEQLQKELDAAHHLYLGNLGTSSELQKAASQFGLLTKGVGMGYLALLASALGSGVVANRMLQKFFPPIQRPGGDRPRKVIIRSEDPDQDVVEEPDGGVTPDATEHLVRTSLANPKAASVDGGLADLIAAAAQGRCDEIRENVSIGVDFMFDAVKGARHEKTSSVNRNLAITWVSTDPLVSEAIQPVLAAEFHDMSPGLFKMASYVPREYHNSLVGVVESATQEVRRSIYSKLATHIPAVKSAGAAGAVIASDLLEYLLLSQGLKNTMSENQGSVQGHNRQPNHIATPMSKDSPNMADHNKGLPDYQIEDADAQQFAQKYGPSIDNAMQRV
jgi:hypothetical protein